MGPQLKLLLGLLSYVLGQSFNKGWKKQKKKHRKPRRGHVFYSGKHPDFSINSSLYSEQMKMYLAILQEKMVLMRVMCTVRQMGDYYLC